MLENSLRSMSLTSNTQSIKLEKEQEKLKEQIKTAFDEAHNPT